MTFAWYAHLRNLHNKAWYIAALVSWNIALFEYLLAVPESPRVIRDWAARRRHGIRAVRRVLHAPTCEERLSLGGCLFARRGVFYFSRISTAARLQPGSLVPRAVRFRMTQGCEGHQGYRAVGRDAQAWHATIVSLSAARAP